MNFTQVLSVIRPTTEPVPTHSVKSGPDRPRERSRHKLIPLICLVLLLFTPSNHAHAAPTNQAGDDITTEIAALTVSTPTFADDFSRWDERWTLGSDGGLTNYNGSAEAVAVQGLGDNVGWITHVALDALDLTDYFVETTVVQSDAEPGEFIAGLLFRYVDADNFYVFALRHSGNESGNESGDELTYMLVSVEAGSERNLIDPQPIDLAFADTEMDNNSLAQLGVYVVGDQITLLVDGAVVDTVTDATHSAGAIGLGAAAGAGVDLSIQFDDVALWALDDLPPVESVDAITPTIETDETEIADTEIDPASDERKIAADEAMDDLSADSETSATLETQLADLRSTEPAVVDEFRRGDESWSGESSDLLTLTVDDGVRHVTVEPGGVLYDLRTDLPLSSPTDYLVEVDASIADAVVGHRYGLLFRYQDAENFYLFALDGETYTLWRKLNNEWTALVDTRGISVMAEEADYRLGVLVQGETIVLLINDTVVEQLHDDTVSAGGVGLYAEALAATEATAALTFDNFELWLVDEPLDLPPVEAASAAREDAASTEADTADARPLDIAAVEAQLAAIYAQEADFYDEFRREDGTWLGDEREAVTITYEDRTRQIAVEPNLIVTDLHAELLDLMPANYLAEIDTSSQRGAEQSQYGLVFRYQDAQNFYYYGLWRNAYSLWVQEAGTWTKLIDWTTAETIDEGGENRLGVLAQGSTITLLLNDTVTDRVVDERFTTGGVGLYVETEAEGEAVVAFDNFDFWLVAASVEDAGVEEEIDSEPVAEHTALLAAIRALREREAEIYDGFRRDTGEWHTRADETREIAIVDRTLTFASRIPNSLSLSAYTPEAPIDFSDYYIEVTGTYVDGESTGNYGLLFRYVDSENFYFFDINNGGYGLLKLEEGEWVDLVSWTADERVAAEPGVSHRMGVWAVGAEIALLIDDQVVATVSDDTFPAGGIGLAAGTYDAESFVANFDDLQVWALTAEADETVESTPVVTPVATPTVATPTGEPTATPDEEPAATVTPDAPATTALYEDETFRFPYPADWEVTVEAGVVTARSPVLDATLVIVPLYAPQPIDSAIADALNAQWIELMEIGEVAWSEPQAWGETGRRVTGSSADRTFLVAGTWVNTTAGSAYYLYTTGVKQTTAADAAPAFVQIMDGFTLKGSLPPIAPAGPTLAFETWEEPTDGAFSLAVPEGWEIDGGVLQLSDIDQRRWVTALSPDERIFTAVGDSRVSAFIEPNAALTAQGYGEGDSFFLGDTEFIVWPYRPGEEFLVDYANYYLDLTDCELTPDPLPDLTQAIRAHVQRNALAVEFGNEQDAGLLTYTCGSGDNEYVGFLVAVTAAYDADGTTLWQPSALYAYEALPDEIATAATALQQMILTYTTDEAWLQDALGYTAREATALNEHTALLAQLIAEAVPTDGGGTAPASPIDPATMDEFMTINAPVTGAAVTTYLDPTLGWLDSAENLLGTDTSALPTDVDFAEIVEAEVE